MFRNRWKDTLRRVISDMRTDATPQEYALGRLQELVHPPSRVDLIEELSKLVEQHELQVVYRVISPTTGAGLIETDDITTLPADVRDDTTGLTFRLDPLSDLEIVYRVQEN